MLQSLKAGCGSIRAGILDFGDPCETIDLPEDFLGRVRAQQVRAVARLTPVLVVANIVNACALVVVLQLSRQFSVEAGIWAGIAIAVALRTLWQSQRRRGPFPTHMRKQTGHRVVRSAALHGLIWMFPGLVLLPEAHGTAQAFLAALLTGMIGGGALALHPIPAAALVFTGMVTAGGLFGLAATGEPTLIGFVMIAFAFFFVVSRNILRHSEIFVSEFVGKLDLEQKNRLIDRLLEEIRSEAREEKRRSEDRLAQAQKMEAIGQLTGGVAHDFNNLLAAIQGHAELIALEGRSDPSLVAPIVAATERGSDLVQRLLSVARKQSLRPETIAVERLIGAMTSLLRRTLGPQIEIETRIDADLWNAQADPGQLEAAILNLVLNARDAMPDGGRVVIEAGNARARACAALRRLRVRAGEFVQIAVRDTGRGMTPGERERSLEPFFTTKKFGERSGLGLSTTFGFVQQSGGHLAIESEVGAGTTVRLFLPRSRGALPAEPARQAGGEEGAIAPGRGETILVVEDDEDVRPIIAGMLESLGYRVVAAADAIEGLRLLEAGSRVDLVLSDVVLPGGMSGIELAERLAAERPELPVTLMSGYPDGAGARMPDGAGRTLLEKPFQRRELAERIRSALGAGAGAGAEAALPCSGGPG